MILIETPLVVDTRRDLVAMASSRGAFSQAFEQKSETWHKKLKSIREGSSTFNKK